MNLLSNNILILVLFCNFVSLHSSCQTTCNFVTKDEYYISKSNSNNLFSYIKMNSDSNMHQYINAPVDSKFKLWRANADEAVLHHIVDNKPFTIILKKSEKIASEVNIINGGFLDKKTVYTIDSFIVLVDDSIKLEIPFSDLTDLGNPNFCNVEIPIMPVSAFYSHLNDRIFIYLFGQDQDKVSPEIENSYLVKFIFEKNVYKGRLFTSGRILHLYNWENTCWFNENKF